MTDNARRVAGDLAMMDAINNGEDVKMRVLIVEETPWAITQHRVQAPMGLGNGVAPLWGYRIEATAPENPGALVLLDIREADDEDRDKVEEAREPPRTRRKNRSKGKGIIYLITHGSTDGQRGYLPVASLINLFSSAHICCSSSRLRPAVSRRRVSSFCIRFCSSSLLWASSRHIRALSAWSRSNSSKSAADGT